MQSSDVLDVKKWTERFCFFSFKRDAKVCSAGSQTQFKKPRRVLVESKDMQVSSISKIIIGEVVTEISPFISRHILAKLAECYFHTYSFFF